MTWAKGLIAGVSIELRNGVLTANDARVEESLRILLPLYYPTAPAPNVEGATLAAMMDDLGGMVIDAG